MSIIIYIGVQHIDVEKLSDNNIFSYSITSQMPFFSGMCLIREAMKEVNNEMALKV